MEIQWPLTFFSVLAGCGGVTFAFVALSEIFGNAKQARFSASIVSLVLVIVGGCCSVLHLAQKANIMAAAANVFSFSPISLELIFVGLTSVAVVVYLLVVRNGQASAAKIVAIIGGICGLILGYVTGSGYVMQAQPNWDTILLPLAYLGTDLACGALVFLVCMAIAKVSDDERAKYYMVIGICGIIELVAVLAYAATTGFAVDPAEFWIGCVIACGVVTCLVGFGSPKVPALTSTGAISACAIVALCGSLCLRLVMWGLGTGWLMSFTLAAEHALL